MRATIRRSTVSGAATAPPSKSYTHRAIVIGALGEGSTVRHPLLAEDTRATIAACERLGARVEHRDGALRVTGVEGAVQTPEDVVNVANSGTTLRFMSAAAALAPGTTVLTGDGSIRARPNGGLLDALNQLGARASSTRDNGCAPLVVTGRMKGGAATIAWDVSSQFISALLIAAPLTESGANIHVTGERLSRSYVNMTVEVLGRAGARVATEEARFIAPGEQSYRRFAMDVPGDFSSAAFLLAAGAIAGRVKVRGLIPSAQGDERALSLLSEMGAAVRWDRRAGTVTVERAPLCGIKADLSDNPDLVPVLAVLGALAEGTTELRNVAHARFKESDRLRTTATELRRMGARVQERPDGLAVRGGALRGARVKSYGDHRIAMAMAVAALGARGATTIEDVGCVEISFPGFFDALRRIGAGVEVA